MGGEARRGHTYSAAGGEKAERGSDRRATGPSDVSYRRAMRSAGPKAVVVLSLSLPFPSRERFCFLACSSFLNAAAGGQTRGIYAENGGGGLRGEVEEEAVGASFERVRDVAEVRGG